MAYRKITVLLHCNTLQGKIILTQPVQPKKINGLACETCQVAHLQKKRITPKKKRNVPGN
jgi:hypothetical protein